MDPSVSVFTYKLLIADGCSKELEVALESGSAIRALEQLGRQVTYKGLSVWRRLLALDPSLATLVVNDTSYIIT